MSTFVPRTAAFGAVLLLAGCTGTSDPADPSSAKSQSWLDRSLPANAPEVVRRQYAAIEQAVATSGTVTVPVILHVDNMVDVRPERIGPGSDHFGSEDTVALRLKPSGLLPADAFFEINGVPADWPFIRVYEGHVDGAPDEIAHVVVAGDFIRGAVRRKDPITGRGHMSLIRINMDGNLPVAMQREPRDPGTAPENRPPQSPEPSNCPDDTYGNLIGIRPLPPYGNAEYAAGLAAGPVLRSRVILDADWMAARRWGEHLPAMMVGMTAEMDLTYQKQVGIRHVIAGVHQNLVKDFYPEIGGLLSGEDPVDTMPLWWDNHHAGERDIVHLFTGWGSDHARANCIGGAGTTAGYAFTPLEWEEQYAWFHQNAFAHEWGHLYSAHHHYGNHLEADGATIMIQGYTYGAQPIFGTLEKTVIRGWAEQYLKPWQ